MPRDAPVTSAIFPSSEAKVTCFGGERFVELVERSEIVHRDGLHAAVDSLHEPGEHVARADLDEGAHAFPHQLGGCLREAHRRGELVDEQRPHPLRRLEPRSHRRHERRNRLLELDPLHCRPQPVGGAGHERRVERARDLQLDRPARARLLRSLAALVHRVVLAGDDDLPGAVVVRRPHAEDLAAEHLDHLVVEAEDRRHRAGMPCGSLGHGDAALAHELDRLLGRHRFRRGKRRELADRMADDEVRLDPARAYRRKHGERGRDERRLLHGRLDEVLDRPRGSRAARGRARMPRCRARRRSAPPARPRRCHVPSPSRSTPGRGSRTRSSSRRHLLCPSHQRRTPREPRTHPGHQHEPPGCAADRGRASARASGIEPEDVFP